MGKIQPVVSRPQILEKIKKTIKNHGIELHDAKVDDSIYLFCSFDLTNSTEFKTRYPEKWVALYGKFYSSILAEVEKKHNGEYVKFSIWKFAGDEILFYHKISHKADLFLAPVQVQSILRVCIEALEKDTENNPIGTLSLKATLWIAKVSTFSNIFGNLINGESKLYNPREHENIHTTISPETHLNSPDFLGKDIDLGFRISKHASRARVTISADYAYLLLRFKKDIEKLEIPIKPVKDLRIVEFADLKGIWANRKYPIIWFDTEWDTKNMFLYDEEFSSIAISNVKNPAWKKNHPIDKLAKIFSDLRLSEKFQKLYQQVDGLLKEERPQHTILPPIEQISELRCVAVCVTKTGRVLIAKRASGRNLLPDTWEFGSASLALNQSFEEAIQASYKRDFGIDLLIGPKPKFIGTFIFSKNGSSTKVPGIVFYAEVKGTVANPQCLNEKHTKCKFVNPLTYKLNKHEKYVPDFQEVLSEAVAIWNKKHKS